jgi:hypothetical protein
MNPEKQSKQRKMLAAVLALGLGGLAVDRLLLDGGATGPQEAAAQQDLSPNAAATDAIISNTTPKTIEITRSKTVAGRLDRMAAAQGFNLTEVQDAFRPSSAWTRATSKPTAAEKTAPKETEAEAFAKSHKLMAVVHNSAGGAAIIGNRTITVGREIDGFTLVLVTPRGAVLEKDGQRVELNLPRPQQNNVQD